MKNYNMEPIISNYLSTKASAKRVPVSGTFELLPLCNMDCKMCYVKMTKKDMEPIGRLRTVEEWIEIAKEAKKEGLLFLLLTGGEPFLYKGFKQLYKELNKMGFLISINTNGTLIDKETAEWLIEDPPTRINISLYGGSNETYARLCNNPNGFTQVTNAIKYLKKSNIPIKLNASVTPYNVDDIEDIFKFAEENELYVQSSSYMFPPTRRKEELAGMGDRFSYTDAAKARMRIDKIRFDEEVFNKRIVNLKNGIVEEVENDDFCGKEKGVGEGIKCRAGKCSFWITWDGRMTPCGMMNYPVTHPFNNSFSESWRELVDKTNEIRTYPGCLSCKFKNTCNTCAAMIQTETGKFDEKPTYICNMEEEFYKCVLSEYEKNNKGEI